MKHEILVIDDNFDIRNLISGILKDKNSNAIVSAIPNIEEKNIDKLILHLHNEFRKHIWNYESQSIEHRIIFPSWLIKNIHNYY